MKQSEKNKGIKTRTRNILKTELIDFLYKQAKPTQAHESKHIHTPIYYSFLQITTADEPKVKQYNLMTTYNFYITFFLFLYKKNEQSKKLFESILMNTLNEIFWSL